MEQPNRFKAALGRGESQIGLWVALANAYTAEICAGAGFDWLLLDGEHAPNDIPLLLGQLQAIAAYPATSAVVRPPAGDAVLIKQLLDLGAQTLLVPMIETAEQAAAMVAAMRYPPRGVRGVGSSIARASRWNRTPSYLHSAEADLCLVVQVETASGVRNAGRIAAVDGVDGVFIGPSDLAASMGHLGEAGHPEVVAAAESAIRAVRSAGKAAGVLTTAAPLVARYRAAGCSFVAVGTDVGIFARGLDELSRAYR